MQPTTVIDGRLYNQSIGSAREAIDALRPLAGSQATLDRWASELVNWFSVVSPGALVIAWRRGTTEYVRQTARIAAT